jgi:membrane-associated HD superfamily phosphohydrolase
MLTSEKAYGYIGGVTVETNLSNTNEASAEIETPLTKRDKKKKRKVSKELKPLEKLDRDLTKAERRIAKAVLAGVESWQTSSKKSSKKRRDGALRDVVKNSAKAYAKVLDRASRVPADVVDLLYPSKS